jgi:glycosyltransferase involved in cell wall biosynthesis
MKMITIVCPMRNEAELLQELCYELDHLSNKILEKNLKVEIIFIDNASTDATKDVLTKYAPRSTKSRVLRYIRNNRDLGLQSSLMTSMEIANGDALVVLHSDLEDPPELILEFIDAWILGKKAIVGVMKTRSDPKLYQFTSKIFYRILKATSDLHVLANFTDFFLIDKSIYSDIARRPHSNQYIRGIISANYGVDLRIPYDRRRRKAGNTNFNFAKRYEVALDAIFALGNRIPRYTTLFSFALLCWSLLLWPIKMFSLEFMALEPSQLFFLNIFLFSVVIIAFSFELLFRIYNFLLSSTSSLTYEEIALDSIN